MVASKDYLQQAQQLIRAGGWAWLALLATVAAGWIWIALLIIWLAEGANRIDGLYVPFVSDVGARHQTLFIVGTALLLPVAIAQALVLQYLQWKRARQARLLWKLSDTVLALLVVGLMITSTIGAILVARYDTEDWSTLHSVFAWIFFMSTWAGMVLVSAQLFLWRRHAAKRGQPGVSRYYGTGAATTTTLVVMVFVLGVAAIAIVVNCDEDEENCDHEFTVGAVLEWVIVALYTLYLGSLFLVLRPLPCDVRHEAQMRAGAEKGGVGEPQPGHSIDVEMGRPDGSDVEAGRPADTDAEAGRPAGTIVG